MAFAFFSAGGVSITSISEAELIVDALRLPGCLPPTDDRFILGDSSDREADPRVSDCCVGLCNHDDLADWREQARHAGDMPRRAAAIACMTPPVSSSSRRDVSFVSDIRVSASSRANALSHLRASWNPSGVFSERTLSPVARAAKSSRESDALLRIPPSVGALLGAISHKLSTQSHSRLVACDPGTVRPDELREGYTKSAMP